MTLTPLLKSAGLVALVCSAFSWVAASSLAAKGNPELQNFMGKFAGLFKTADHATMVDAEMVQFPLRLKGTLDDSPEIKVTEKQFAKVLPKIANQPSGMNPKNFKQTEKDYISSQVVRGALPTDAGEGTVRLGNLVFGKKSKKWKLVMVYTSDELIAEINKGKKAK